MKSILFTILLIVATATFGAIKQPPAKLKLPCDKWFMSCEPVIKSEGGKILNWLCEDATAAEITQFRSDLEEQSDGNSARVYCKNGRIL